MSAAPDPALRQRLLEFELALDSASADQVVRADWGRAFLTPSLPLVWDASWIAVEQVGMAMRALAAIADRVLGEIGVAHRAVVPCDEADGERLAGEAAGLDGWEVERVDYMVWRTESGRRARAEVRETKLEEIAALRKALIAEWLPRSEADPAATIEQLVALDGRFGEIAGDRWFVSTPERPVSACKLLADGAGTGQVEDVGTLRAARGAGLAQAVVLAALAESRAAGHEVTFLSADAGDWPRLMYERLGFERVGGLHILRRAPT